MYHEFYAQTGGIPCADAQRIEFTSTAVLQALVAAPAQTAGSLPRANRAIDKDALDINGTKVAGP